MNLENCFSALKYITNSGELKHIRIEFLCGQKHVNVRSFTCVYTTKDNQQYPDIPVKTVEKVMWDYEESFGYSSTDTQERNIFYKKDIDLQKRTVDIYEMAFSFIDASVKRVIVY